MIKKIVNAQLLKGIGRFLLKPTIVMATLLLSSTLLFAQDESSPALKPPGVVIDYSPASSGVYIGSPSLAVLPNGDYLASHDFFGPKGTERKQGITAVFKSKNKGKSWTQVAEVKGQFWSKLFLHKKELYLIGTYKEYGNMVIRKSKDEGATWTIPTDSLNGLLLVGRYHCAPMPIVEHNGRLWRGMEDAMGPVKGWGKMFGSFMMSAPIGSDLLKSSSWEQSNTLRYDSTYLSGHFAGWLEGNAVVAPNGKMVNVLRAAYEFGGNEKAAIIDISEDGKKATFDSEKGFVDFPGGSKKFTIHYDKKTKLYYTLSNYIPEKNKTDYIGNTRNVLALCSSADLRSWDVKSIILEHPDKLKHGFQYVDWQFDGKDIIGVSRTAFDDAENGAKNFHDANYLTFHRIKNFRKLNLSAENK